MREFLPGSAETDLCILQSGFTRPPRLAPGLGLGQLRGAEPSGDWLGVRGRWRCEAYRFDAPRVGAWPVGEYEVAPVSFGDLKAAYAARSKRADAHIAHLDVQAAHDMPVVYFTGEGRGLPRDARGENLVGDHFVCGAARLTPDNPPQVAWTWVLENTGRQAGYEDFVVVVEAVQAGGAGARAGLYGVSSRGGGLTAEIPRSLSVRGAGRGGRVAPQGLER
jgi:hypothetical protein